MKKLIGLLSLLVVISATALVFRDGSYEVYHGDVDNDGVDDIYLRAMDRLLVVGIEISTPVIYQDGPSMLMKGNGDGSFAHPEEWTAEVDTSLLQANAFNIFLADMNGDGLNDLLLQSTHVSRHNVILYTDGQGDLSVSYSFDTVDGQYASADHATWSLQDINSDGKIDLILNEGTSSQKVAISEGMFGLFDQQYGTASYISTPTGLSDNIVVGATPGEINVSGFTGSASYSIPIAVPVGPGGVSPNLSILYSSTAGDSELGKGFSLQGLGRIHRCSTTNLVEGYVESPKTHSEGGFCMDGQRLIRVNGSDKEYRLQVDSIAKVMANASSSDPNVVYSWTVYYKSGEREYYGYGSENSRIKSSGLGVHSWLVSRRQDVKGNGYDIHYHGVDDEETLGTVRVIKYRHSSEEQGGENITIDFQYDGRRFGTERLLYNNGTEYYRRTLLSHVVSKVGGETYRKYNLVYDRDTAEGTGNIRLEKIQECGADGTCFSPTVFEWNDFEGSLTFNQSVSMRADICPNNEKSSVHGNCDKPHYYNTFQYPDVNGDGVQDVCYRSTYGVVCHLSQYNRFRAGENVYVSHLCKYSGDSVGCNGADNHSTIKYLDFDRDGKDDLLFRSDDGLKIYKWTGSKFSPMYYQDTADHFGQACPNGSQCHNDHYNIYTPDLNGDGRLDICWITDNPKFRCMFSQLGSGYNDAYDDPVDVFNLSRYDLKVIQFPDLNGDGAQDLLLRRNNDHSASVKGIVAYTLDFSSGSPVASIYAETGECTNVGSDNNDCNDRVGYQIVVGNVNGDAYDDACYRAGYGMVCLLSTGIGFNKFEDFNITYDGKPGHSNLGVCGDRGIDLRNSQECYEKRNNSLTLTDINGDGMDDLFFRGVGGPTVAISTGKGFVIPYIRVDVCKDTLTDTDCKNNDNNFSTVSLADIDNDGYQDVVYRNDSGLKVHYARATTDRYLVDTLKSVTNGHGLKHTINYTTMMDSSVYLTSSGSHKPWNDENTLGRTHMPIVASVSSSTVNGGESTVNYEYKDYITMTSLEGGSGFRNSYVIKRHADGKGFKTETEYHTEFPLSGNVKKTIEYRTWNGPNSWVKDVESTTNWVVRKWRENVSSPSTEKAIYSLLNKETISKEYVDFNKLYKVTKTINKFDGENSESSIHSADKFNDVTRQIVRVYAKTQTWDASWGGEAGWLLTDDNWSSAPYSEIQTLSYYKEPNVAAWVLGRLEKTEVHKRGYDGSYKTQSSEWAYDYHGMLARETFAPDTEYETETYYEYNSRGQKTKVTVRPASGQDSVTRYEYVDGYLYKTTNNLGHESIVLRHQVLGVPETTIDINGFITNHEYDGFGRLTRSFMPSGVISETTLADGPEHFAGTRYTKTTSDNLGGFNRVYHDKAGFKLGTASKGADGVIRYQKFEHNDVGMVVKTYLPKQNTSSFNEHSAITGLDQKLRVTSTRNMRGHTSSASYAAYSKTVTNPLGQQKIEYVGPNGKTLKVKQIGPDGGSHTIYYAYDLDGNLTKTTTENTTIVNHYDAAGRRTQIDDPDKGVWTYKHNALNQLVLQQNGKGYQTCFAYDQLGRKVKRIEDYSGSLADARDHDCRTSQNNPKVTEWIYDSAPLGTTGSLYKGALHQVVNADGNTETYFYDNQGRVVRVDRNIKGTVYSELKDYDQFSRLYTHTYPSGLRVRNIYNEMGALEKVINHESGFTYWETAGYDSLGRVKSTRLGNGLYEHTQYSAVENVVDKQMVSTSSAFPNGFSASTHKLWLEYEYDALDNYTDRRDLSLGLHDHYQFDHLNRLTTATLSHNGTRLLSETMQYQRNGNIHVKPGVGTYSYGQTCSLSGISGTAQAGPHAVSRVTAESGAVTQYCYDANGNMIADNKRQLTYANSYDKPLRITHENGASIDFAYDHNRSRYYRKDEERGRITETFYAASGYERVIKNVGELTETQLEKHYIAGSVVEIHTNGNRDLAERRYLHKDNLGSVVMITNGQKQIIERHNFDPWGQKRSLSGLRIPEYLQLEASAGFIEKDYFTYKADLNNDGKEDLYVQSAPNWILIAQSPAFLIPQYQKAWLYLGTGDGTYEAPVEYFNNLNVSNMTLAEDAPLRNDTTQMGFTGHEQLDSVGLVHMGGRIYDPILGRMLNADPFIQAPSNSQSFNRYSYVVNNPVSLNDPSGYLFGRLKRAVSRFGSYVGSRGAQFDDWQRSKGDQFGNWFREKAAANPKTFAILQMAACAAPAVGIAGCAAIQGISTGVITKDFKAGVRTFATAYAYGHAAKWIGHGGANGGPGVGGGKLGRIAAHGAIGGVNSRVNGGSFWRGAISTMAAEGFAEYAPTDWRALRGDSRLAHAIEGALIGGTTAVIMGGGTEGFVNGAKSGAMSRLFNFTGGELLNERDDCIGNCTLWTNPETGDKMWINQSSVPDAELSTASGSESIGQYTNTTRQEKAEAIGIMAIGAAPVSGPAALVLGGVATGLDPTWQNFFGLAVPAIKVPLRSIDQDLYLQNSLEKTLDNFSKLNDINTVKSAYEE